MEVLIHSGINNSKEIKGVGVVIDVFRATTTIACLINARADKIIVIPDAEKIKKYCNLKNHVCFSELVKEGYDNSPTVALTSQIRGKTAVISTTNGTKSIIAAKNCEKIITASFVNIDAVVNYLIELEPPVISLIPAGHIPSNTQAVEDTLCAHAIRNRLQGLPIDDRQIRKILFRAISDRTLDLNNNEDYQVYVDMLLCCAIGILNVVPEVIFDKKQILITNAQTQISLKN